MMDCQKVKQLLPLWIGQDLPDSASTMEVARHVEKCSACEQHRQGLQASLDVLQGSSAETLSDQPIQRSVWPSVAMHITDWELGRGRERFNGWIPASVMALAVALMIAVSVPSIRDEFFNSQNESINTADLFQVNPAFEVDERSNPNRPAESIRSPQRRAFGTPVIYKKSKGDPEQF